MISKHLAAPWRGALGVARAWISCGVASSALLVMPMSALAADDWPMFGQNIQNTASTPAGMVARAPGPGAVLSFAACVSS